MHRASSEKSVLDPNKRSYQIKEGNPPSTLTEIKTKLKGMYDIILLHDSVDGCLVLNLMKDATAELTELPCKLHIKK